MPIRGFSHVAIGVTDMARSLDFYCNVLGLEVSFDHQEKMEMDAVSTYQRRAAYLQWPGDRSGSFVVLDTQERTGAPLPARGFNDTGMHHFGFWVDDDLGPIYDRAVAAGCPIVQSFVELAADHPANPTGQPAKTALFRDPDGNIIQLDGIKPGTSLA